MSFEEWWEENKEAISADCEIAATETLKSWFRQAFAEGMNRGERYVKDKIKPQLDKIDRLIKDAMKPREPVPEEIEADKRKQKAIEQTPEHYYKEGDKVQVYIKLPNGIHSWADGVVVVRNFSSLRGDKEVLVEIKRPEGGTDDMGSDYERRNFPFTHVRKVG